MHIDFLPLSMMDLRAKPGEVLDDVERNGRAFVIERNGHQKACLVPISFFLPDIPPSRISKELDKLFDANEHFRMTITDEREIQILFRDLVEDTGIEVAVTLPHGYPNRSPIAVANPIDKSCPHLWQDGSLCIYGAMDTWNPGKDSIVNVLKLCRRWLANYASWQQTGKWPSQGGL